MEYWLYLSIGAVIIAVMIGGYVWQQGLLGTASEERIKRILGRLSVQSEHWEQQLTDKIAARKVKEAKAPQPPLLTQAISNMEAIKCANYLRENKLITEDHYKKLVDGIMS